MRNMAGGCLRLRLQRPSGLSMPEALRRACEEVAEPEVPRKEIM